METCYLCGNPLSSRKIDITVNWKGKHPITLSGIPALVCTCGERLIDDEYVELIQTIAAGVADTSTSCKPDKILLSTDDVANLLNVSTQTIYNMLKDGRLKANKFGREWRFDSEYIKSLVLDEDLVVAARGEVISKNDQEEIIKALKEDDSEYEEDDEL